MHEVNIQEAEKNLSLLIDEVAIGEDVIIRKDDGTSYRIVPLIKKEPVPVFGSSSGLIKISGDFDDSLEDFQEYMR